MKVYVDELPKSCATCPCSEFNFDYGYGCNMLDVAIKDADLKNESCPLQSLSDYTKRVRKEVCEEIRKILLQQRQETNKQIEDISNDVSYWAGRLDCLDVFEFEILDQIQD